MKTTRLSITLFVAVTLVASACTQTSSSTTAAETSTTATPAETSSSTSTTSTTAATTTTTEAPLQSVQVLGDLLGEIANAASVFLSAVQDPRNDSSTLEAGLVEHHSAAAGLMDDEYTAIATTQELETGGSVGVLTLDSGDVLLVADDGGGWNVVGADLSSSQAIPPWFGESPRRVLVLGSDARPGAAAAVSRMDSIHILTAVPETGQGTILGYPRDSYVESPFGPMRINALTTSGRGPDAIFDQFTEEWDIPLDGYILTAFSGFERLVGATIGRLLITLPRGIPVQKYWSGWRSGEQTITPPRLLEYARTRKGVPGGDFTRSANHGVIMLATLAMFQQGTVADTPMLVGELVKYTETNLAPSDLIQLAASAFALDLALVDNVVLPGKLGRGAGGASVVLLDDNAPDIVADVIEDGILDSEDG